MKPGKLCETITKEALRREEVNNGQTKKTYRKRQQRAVNGIGGRDSFHHRVLPHELSAPSMRDPLNSGAEYTTGGKLGKSIANWFGGDNLDKYQRQVGEFMQNVVTAEMSGQLHEDRNNPETTNA